MFGRKKIDKENVYELYISLDKDITSTVKKIVEIYKLKEDFALSILQDVILSKLPLRKIYCIDCGWDNKLAIQKIMEETNFDYFVCKAALDKMIMECDLNTAKFRIERSLENTVTSSYEKNDNSQSPKQQYKANKKAGIVSCPKCGSQSITTTNKKISVGKGIVGASVGAMVNPVGTVIGGAVGATHSKKIYNVCMNCGHKWKP